MEHNLEHNEHNLEHNEHNWSIILGLKKSIAGEGIGLCSRCSKILAQFCRLATKVIDSQIDGTFDDSLSHFAIDIVNAYGTISRRQVEQGVCCLGLQLVFEKVQAAHAGVEIWAFIDDMTMVGRNEESKAVTSLLGCTILRQYGWTITCRSIIFTDLQHVLLMLYQVGGGILYIPILHITIVTYLST